MSSGGRRAAARRYARKHPQRVKKNHERWRKRNRAHVNRMSLSGQSRRMRRLKAPLLKRQKNKCAICGKRVGLSDCLDHCHKTKKNRGVLCRKCNLGLGHFGDNPRMLRKALKYLRKWE